MAVSDAKVERDVSIESSKGLWGGIIFAVAFTASIAILRPILPQIDFLPDQGALWYFWKLPEPTFWTRFTAWGGYVLHQITIWGLIYYAQSLKLRYQGNLHWVNILALGANAFFVLLHLLQTGIWYDGLAQDTAVWTSQGSVIILLVMVLIIENKRRGLVFGKKIGFFEEPGRVLRKYHGYVFSWAVIYTFWFHPMESTYGHLLGTFYTLLLMLQGSLFFTNVHTNRWWTLSLEFFVVIHGTLVATMATNNGSWPMFLFGFLALFVVTQMHGLGLSKRIRWTFILAYSVGVVGVYAGRGWYQVEMLPNIPVVEYGLAFVIAFVIWLPLMVRDRLRTRRLAVHAG